MRRALALLLAAALLAQFAGLTQAGGATPAPRATLTPDRPSDLTLQIGNSRPVTAIHLKSVAGLTGTGIGDVFPMDRYPLPCPSATKDWQLTHVEDLRLTWVRLSVDLMEHGQVMDLGWYSRWAIDPCQDELISRLANKGVTILMTIMYWDETLNATRPPDYSNEEEVQLYLDYARFLVHHYKDRIHYWEILNEAIHYVALEDYLNLVRRAAPVIRAEDPQAKIVAGGSTTLLYQDCRDYILGLLNSDVVAQLDGINIHPMYGVSPQYEDTAWYYAWYPDMIRQGKRIAAAHGFTGEWIAEEMDWRTPLNPNQYEPWTYTPTVAAKYYARGIVINLGLGVWAGIGGELYYAIAPIPTVVRNLSAALDGATPTTVGVQVDTTATKVATYAFTLRNGGRLIALWDDGVAADAATAASATVTIAGASSGPIVGIDVLNGVQQHLVTEVVGQNLVVRNLLLTDYPLFLRLEK